MAEKKEEGKRGLNIDKKWLIAPVVLLVLVAGALVVQGQGIEIGNVFGDLGIDLSGTPPTPTALPTSTPRPTPTPIAPPGEQMIGAIEEVGTGFWRLPGIDKYRVAIVPGKYSFGYSVLTLVEESNEWQWLGNNKVVIQRPNNAVGLALIRAPQDFDYSALSNYFDDEQIEAYESNEYWTLIIQGDNTTITRIMRDLESEDGSSIREILKG